MTALTELDYNTISDEDYKALSSEEKVVIKFNAEEGNLHLKDGLECKRCKNRGYYFDLQNGQVVSIRCMCMNIRHSLRRNKGNSILENLKRYTFAKYKTEKRWQQTVFEKAKEYAENPEGWFYMAGAVGCGKTFICTAILGKLIKEMPCQYMLWREESTKIKSLITERAEYEKEMNPLKECDCLYIDDFLKGRVTEADINLAFEIINSRYASGKITIISSERRIGEILKMDEAIGSRIYERAKGNIITIEPGEDKNYRLRK